MFSNILFSENSKTLASMKIYGASSFLNNNSTSLYVTLSEHGYVANIYIFQHVITKHIMTILSQVQKELFLSKLCILLFFWIQHLKLAWNSQIYYVYWLSWCSNYFRLRGSNIFFAHFVAISRKCSVNCQDLLNQFKINILESFLIL